MHGFAFLFLGKKGIEKKHMIKKTVSNLNQNVRTD